MILGSFRQIGPSGLQEKELYKKGKGERRDEGRGHKTERGHVGWRWREGRTKNGWRDRRRKFWMVKEVGKVRKGFLEVWQCFRDV